MLGLYRDTGKNGSYCIMFDSVHVGVRVQGLGFKVQAIRGFAACSQTDSVMKHLKQAWVKQRFV